MPLTKPKFTSGIIKDDTVLAAEGGWTDCDKIRFHPDKPEVVGGWEKLAAAPNADTPFDPDVVDDNVFDASVALTDAMYPGRVTCAHAWTDLDGNALLAWGTSAGLFAMVDSVIYDITPADFTPDDTTAVTSVYGAGPYGVGKYGSGTAGTRHGGWSLDNWGENLLACNGTLWEWAPVASTDPKPLPVANAPADILHMFVSPERIVVALGTIEFGGVFNPMLIRWSDQGDNTMWAPATTNIAGEFPVAQGAVLRTGMVTRSQNLVWSDTSLYTMQFTGDVNSVFTIRAVGRDCGIIGPYAKCASDSVVFWAGQDNFYAFAGQVPQAIPSKVRREVFDNIVAKDGDQVFAGWNTGFQEPWFFYPDARDNTGYCSRYAMMNGAGDWAIGTFARMAWVRAGVFPYPIAFSTDNKIFYHEVPDAGDAGGPLAAFIESGFVDVGDGDTLYIIKRVMPDFENQKTNVNITFKTRFWANGSITARGPYVATPTTEKLDMRLKARQIAVRFDSAGPPGVSFWSGGAVAFDAQESGEKR